MSRRRRWSAAFLRRSAISAKKNLRCKNGSTKRRRHMNVAFKKPVKPARSLDSIAEALLLPTGIDGVYARTAIFETVVDGLAAFISSYREADTEVLRFPPVMSRRQIEKSGYLKSFPHFLGCVSCLGDDESHVRESVDRYEAGGDW